MGRLQASHAGRGTDKDEMNSNAQTEKFRAALRAGAASHGVSLTEEAHDQLGRYYDLLLRWNARVHLVAPCSPQEFATRHVLESLVALKHLPQRANVAEVGAGAGLPIIPCLIARADLRAILIEAAQKKAIFLREALAEIGATERATVRNERFEQVPTPQVDVVTCRAIERFDQMLANLLQWAPAHSKLLLFGAKRLEKRIESLGYSASAELLPSSNARFLFVVKKE
jgi:16S rRNA (guanine527-N7)-methyltransferase